MEKDIQCQTEPPWAHGMCTHPHEHIHIPLTHLHKEITVQIHSTRVKRKKKQCRLYKIIMTFALEAIFKQPLREAHRQSTAAFLI